MMNYKYFGILTEDMYNPLDEDQILNFFLEKHLITAYRTLDNKKKEDKLTNEKGQLETTVRGMLSDIKYKYSEELLDNIFIYLKSFFSGLIEVNIIMYTRSFDIKTYGYTKKKKRKEAFRKFDKLFFEICKEEQIGLGKNLNNETGAEKRFVTLKKVQCSLIEKLKGEEIILTNYLYGNNDYFTRELIDTHPYLLEIFEFENKLSILIDLNKKFKFEEDDVFTPKPKSELIFKEHSNEFHSLKQVEFIEHQIITKEKVNRAFIVSLFDFFSNILNITTPSGKIFGEIINHYFNFKFGEVSLNGSEGNNHDRRIQELKKEWEIFTN
ncbi:hypothetical protein SAMN05216503_1958 [Polaribacter sp. KT25b]|uniref:hypothetical protein n=1 Tax=Polaribacter sp. KT25b TaxID=1855336 RepID=UPI00087C2972|nr:hypothetical protein [Polaribacter sp. KT25b]SDS09356.1 hypothetical protein SAMN05216503_1958 [Polaribacter sp. KT25b]